MSSGGRVALVTGASSGIGRATAARLACDGATVVVAGRATEALEAAAAGVREHGVQGHVIVADLLQAGSGARLVDAAAEVAGRLDIVVNAAGIISMGSIETTGRPLPS